MPSDNWCASPLNSAKQVRNQLKAPNKVEIREATLNEGEQTAFGGFSGEDKVKIARMLDEMKIPNILAGYVGISKQDTDIIKSVTKLGLSAKIEAESLIFDDKWKEYLDEGVESDVDVLGIVFGMSDIRLKYVTKLTRE